MEVKQSKPKKPALVASTIRPPSVEEPMQDWYQTDTHLVIVVYTRQELLQREFVTVEIQPNGVTIQVILDKYSYFVHFKPTFPVKETSVVSVNKGKVEVKLGKVTAGQHWEYHGEGLSSNAVYTHTKSLAPKYRQWIVTKNTFVSHDTRLLRLKAPSGYTMLAPIGYHIHIVHSISGMQIGRSYTVMPPSLVEPNSDKEQEEGRALHLMIKYYSGGTLTPWVTSVSQGESIMVSNYDGNFDIQRLNNLTHLVLFAAGTGFTSMARLIIYALNMPNATLFSVVNILSQESSNSNWKGLRGRINSEHVQDYVPIPSSKCRPLVCICGPWAYNDTVESLTKLRGLKDEHLHIFAQTFPEQTCL
ncbi:cytochrome b5 reductase 4 [Elysia marginata]|uniref:Cytochrome b5 reductase 4 n=1 Tax=Elysia marginata TaxID=1093978 RepID=A0AAV4IM88_9GAST|nr:cytochrome b5 reductase 4 [Elysia marginata]